jgi:hypothetical protein
VAGHRPSLRSPSADRPCEPWIDNRREARRPRGASLCRAASSIGRWGTHRCPGTRGTPKIPRRYGPSRLNSAGARASNAKIGAAESSALPPPSHPASPPIQQAVPDRYGVKAERSWHASTRTSACQDPSAPLRRMFERPGVPEHFGQQLPAIGGLQRAPTLGRRSRPAR